jgi:hypothetical protein
MIPREGFGLSEVKDASTSIQLATLSWEVGLLSATATAHIKLLIYTTGLQLRQRQRNGPERRVAANQAKRCFKITWVTDAKCTSIQGFPFKILQAKVNHG